MIFLYKPEQLLAAVVFFIAGIANLKTKIYIGFETFLMPDYSWSSNFAVNVLEDNPANIESANMILLVK